MRLALQATFMTVEPSNDESRIRREKIERELRGDERSVKFFQRLRSALAQKELKAPEVFAEESFPDANIVAEYIDGTELSEEIAEEYEKVCWDSPEILAEAGVCFGLLTDSSNQTFEPPKNCRRRLYYIAWEDAARTSSTRWSGSDSNKNEGWQRSAPNDVASTPPKEAVVFSSDVAKAQASKKDIAKTLKAEKKAKRRSRAWIVAVVLLVGVSGASYQGLVDWSVVERALFDAEKETSPKLDNANLTGFQAVSDVSSSDEEIERPEPLVSQATLSSEFGAFASVENDELTDDGVENLAAASVVREETVEENQSVSPRTNENPPRLASNISDKETRNGLDGANFEKRPSIIIPSKNNDVFSSTTRY